jgi:hypothetical protein
MDFIVLELKDVDRINLAQDTDQWRAAVHMINPIRIPQKMGNKFSNGEKGQLLKQNYVLCSYCGCVAVR